MQDQEVDEIALKENLRRLATLLGLFFNTMFWVWLFWQFMTKLYKPLYESYKPYVGLNHEMLMELTGRTYWSIYAVFYSTLVFIIYLIWHSTNIAYRTAPNAINRKRFIWFNLVSLCLFTIMVSFFFYFR